MCLLVEAKVNSLLLFYVRLHEMEGCKNLNLNKFLFLENTNVNYSLYIISVGVMSTNMIQFVSKVVLDLETEICCTSGCNNSLLNE